MESIEEWVEGLRNPNNQIAYTCLQQLQAVCRESNKAFFDTYAEMMMSEHSYIRTRGLLMISACAQWDEEYRIDELIDEYLKHVEDIKPISARQCIQTLPHMARYKPDLIPEIVSALHRVNLFRYPNTMQPLLQKDISDALKQIHELMQKKLIYKLGIAQLKSADITI